MKRLALLFFPAALLSGCGIIIEGSPNSGGSGVTVYSLQLGSNYTLGSGITYRGRYYPAGNPVVCNDRPTTLNYSFAYSGDLASWTSQLFGVDSGTASDYKEYYLTNYPPYNGRVTVSNYVVGAGTVPQSTGSGVSAQGITPVPTPQRAG